jgi:PspAA-like protein
VIVRLMGEGQWRVDDNLADRLRKLDEEAERAVGAGDDDAFHAALRALVAVVRASGEKLDDTHLSPSDLIVPPEDLTLEEAHELIHGDGLIPDLP